MESLVVEDSLCLINFTVDIITISFYTFTINQVWAQKDLRGKEILGSF